MARVVSPDLTPLLAPRAVAVVGASPDATRPGGRALAYLKRYGFPGPLYPINPKYDAIDGVPCFPDFQALPEAPDMAVVAVPAARVAGIVRDAQARGVAALTIYSSGFAEIGPAGAALEAELRAIAQLRGTLVCGPNGQGVANFLDHMCAYFTSELGQEDQVSGGIGFVSQSGVFGGVMASECRRRGLGLGYLVSTGNEAGIELADAIAHFARDPRIRVIAGYLEGSRDARALRDAVASARAADKPVIILKAGRSSASAAAAASHTGALAGAHEVYAAAFRQWGVTMVGDIDALYDAIEAASRVSRKPRGRRVAVLTNSGGIGVLCADAAIEEGLALSVLADETEQTIRADLPGFASARNPIDITLQQIGDPDCVERHVRTLAADPNVDVVLAFLGVTRRHVARTIAGMARAAGEIETPLVTGWLGGDPDGPATLREAGLTAFETPRAALSAIRALVDQAAGTAPGGHGGPLAAEAHAAAEMLARHAADGARVLPELAAKRVLTAAGLPVTRSALADSAAAACAFARAWSWPVALKIESPGITHRSDIGGVALGIASPEELIHAYDAMLARARAARPEAVIQGVSVHEMVSGVVAELLVGVKRDPTFGPVVVVGFGGTLVEVLRDTALMLPPITPAEARAMIESLRGYPALDGARGRERADVDAAARIVARIGDLALAADALAELDVNPLMLRPAGRGAVVADALIALSGPG